MSEQGECLFVWLAPAGRDPATEGQPRPAAPDPDLSRALDQGVCLLLWSDAPIADRFPDAFPDGRPDPAATDRPLDAWIERVRQLR